MLSVKIKLIYTSFKLFFTGIKLSLARHLLNSFTDKHSLSSVIAVVLGRYAERLQMQFHSSEKKFNLLFCLLCGRQ